LSETLFVLLFCLALVALVKAQESVARHALVWAGVAGALLGLSALTRATALGFVPLAALWLYLPAARPSPAARLAVPAVLVGACVVILLPWTVRNYLAYKRFVLVDTTSGYNLWLGSVGVRDEARLHADLLLSVAGMFALPHPLNLLTLLWVALWVAMAFVFFAVTRFRLPITAALLPWAGLGASLLVRPRRWWADVQRLPAAARLAALA